MRGGFQLAGNVLILKLEDFATVAEPIVGAYSQRPHFKLLRENVAADKSYGALYREVTDTIRLPTEFVNRLCDSEYVQHFYSERERAQMRARWSPVTASQAR